eukprot:4350509-Amphidinium_carterae.3
MNDAYTSTAWHGPVAALSAPPTLYPCEWLKTLKGDSRYYGFNPAVERAMLAGGDFLLMPSRYEPCASCTDSKTLQTLHSARVPQPFSVTDRDCTKTHGA